MAPSVVLVTSVKIGKSQTLTTSATTVTTRCGGSDTSHFRVGGLKKNDDNTYYLDYSKTGLPEQNLMLDESQEKIWD